MPAFRVVMSSVRAVSQALALAGVGCLLALALLTVADVIGRFFGRPIPGFIDLATLATAVIVVSFFPILISRKANITLRPFSALRSSLVPRTLDVLGSFITAGFLVLMAWQYVLFAAEATKAGERTAVLRWPVGPWWWVVAVLAAASALVAVVVLVNEVTQVAAKDERR
jgi:TRAP-type C4-dicarboxylate transport system permease small subunit